MATIIKTKFGYYWYCSECNHGPMSYKLDIGCCICFHLREDLRIQPMPTTQPVIDHKTKDCGEMCTSQHFPQIICEDEDALATEPESKEESEDEFEEGNDPHERNSTTHQPNNTFETFQWAHSRSLAMRTLTVKDLLDNNIISEDHNSSDVSDDDTSNSDCSTCTWSSNSTGVSSTMGTDISSRAWSLAQNMVDTLAGTTDWRAPIVTRPANPNGGSSSKRNNSAVTESSSAQASQTGKRQRTAGNTNKAKPPNDRDKNDEDEEEEEGGTKPMKKDANDQPRLPCIFFIQSLRRPDVPLICTNSSLKGTHRLKEHIERKHLVYQCIRCGKCFPKKELLHDHSRKESGCFPDQIPPAFGVNESTLLMLKSKKAMRGRTDEDKWKHMYGIIFPDETHVPSPYDSDIPPSDFLVGGAREILLPKERFWKKLHKALYEKLDRAIRELLEDDTQDVHLREIVNECISQARTETVSPQTSNSEPTDDFPILPQDIDALQYFGSLSNFAGADFEDAEVSSFVLASEATTDALALESVPGQTARQTRRVFCPTTESDYHFVNGPPTASPTEQQDAGPSFQLDVDDADWDFWDLPS